MKRNEMLMSGKWEIIKEIIARERCDTWYPLYKIFKGFSLLTCIFTREWMHSFDDSVEKSLAGSKQNVFKIKENGIASSKWIIHDFFHHNYRHHHLWRL